MKPYFLEELDDTVRKINELSEEGCVRFYLIADSHFYSFSDPILSEPRETFENLKALNEKTGIDCAFHLGDLMWSTIELREAEYWSEDATDEIMCSARDKFLAATGECYFVSGNHDDIDAAEPRMESFYKRMIEFQRDKLCDVAEGKPYYSVDFPEQKVRAICLMSCFTDGDGCHYGYYREQVEWLEDVLLSLTDGYRVLLLAHIDPIGKDRTHAMENEGEFTEVLSAFQRGDKFSGSVFSVDFTKKADVSISAMLVGHGHLDFVIEREPFYIIERAMNHVLEVKPSADWIIPEGAVSPARHVGTYTEELFDTVIFNPRKNTLDIIRFGAGEDAHFDLSERSRD